MYKFEYSGHSNRLEKMWDFLLKVGLVVILLNSIISLFDFINTDVTLNVSCWTFCVLTLTRGLLNFYIIKHIVTHETTFKFDYEDINYEDPLQSKAVSQAVQHATGWADFALTQKKKQLWYDGVADITRGIVLVTCLILMYLL